MSDENTSPGALDGPRTLTDADAAAIAQAAAEAIEKRMVRRFYVNVGKGVWALAWKAVVIAIVALSAYGALKGGVPK